MLPYYSVNGYISTAEEVTTGLRLPTDVTPLR